MKITSRVLATLASTVIAPGLLTAQESSSSTMDTVTVTAEASGYTAPAEVTSGLKVDIPLLETPQAISVVSKELIKDQGARKMEEVLRNTSGVTPGGYYSDWDYYRIRGFDSAFTSYLDGLPGPNGTAEELWGLERVEVIKGPASTLYGQGPLGGFVNMVSKRPQPGFGGIVQFTGGSWDLYEGALDINIPLLTPSQPAPAAPAAKGAKQVQPVAEATIGQGLYFRLNALYREEGSFIDYVSQERWFIAPSLLWQISEDTSLTILASYKEDWINHPFGLPARGTVLPNRNGQLPLSTYIGNPERRNYVNESYLVTGYEFKHRFNDLVSLRQNFRYLHFDAFWDNMLYPDSLDPDQRTLYLWGYKTDGTADGVAVDTALDFTFETGAVKHTFTAGVDYTWDESDYSSSAGITYPSLDLFRPNYRNFTNPVYGPWEKYPTESDQIGFYFQEHAKFFDVFTLTFGGRYDISTSDDNEEEAFSPKVGLTYEFVPGIAAYANYSRSFNPQWSYTDANGAPVMPEEGVNWEGGFKFNLLDGKVTGLLAVYHLTRENVATDNLATPNPFDSIVSGEQRSRGIEFETAAELLPGLDLTFAYTFMDAEVTKDTVIPVGNRLYGAPDHVANVWLKYSIQEGPLKGLGFGAGVTYVGPQAADVYNTFDLPSYTIANAAIYYERERFTAQVNFNNVTDKRYFSGAGGELYVVPGEPFNISASVGWKF